MLLAERAHVIVNVCYKVHLSLSMCYKEHLSLSICVTKGTHHSLFVLQRAPVIVSLCY